MSLPDEERVIGMLRQIKQESAPPRQDWKRIGKERLIRQASTVQQREWFSRLVASAGTLGAAVLMGVWISSGYMSEKSLQQQSSQADVKQDVSEPLLTLPAKGLAANKQDDTSWQATTAIAVQQSPSTILAAAVDAGKAQTGQTAQGTLQTSTQGKAQTTAQTGATVQSQKAAAGSKTPLVEKAERYLREQLGEQSGQYQIDPGHSRLAEGYIAFRRVIQGIPLYENSAAVKVDPDNGDMSLLLYPGVEERGTLSTLPQQDAIIDKSKAAKELAATLRLVYAGKEKPILQYMPDHNALIDARSGKLVTGGKANTVVSVKGEGKPFIIKDREEAADFMRKQVGIDIFKEAFMSIDKQSISFHWELSGNRTATLETDDDGSFIGYVLKGSFNQASKSVSSVQQAQEIALAQLTKLLPSNIKQVELQSAKQESGQARFTFLPMYEGVPLIESPILVTVEMASGIVTVMEGDFRQGSLKFPDKSEAIPLAEAASSFVEKAPLELVYLTGNGESPSLVYEIGGDLEKPWAIDAKTGKIVK